MAELILVDKEELNQMKVQHLEESDRYYHGFMK